jgi:hypothetical protein
MNRIPSLSPSPQWGEGGVRGMEPNVKIICAFALICKLCGLRYNTAQDNILL